MKSNRSNTQYLMYINITRFIILCLFILITASCSQQKIEISSPDKKLLVIVSLSENNIANWQLFKKNNDGSFVEIVHPSLLGLTVNDIDFSSEVEISNISTNKEIKESYSLVSGKVSKVSITYNSQTITLKKEKHELLVHFRVMDDGIAFQYEVLGEGNLAINNEATTFAIPQKGGKAWISAYDIITEYTPAYETSYFNTIPIGTHAPEKSSGWQFPLLFNTSNNWLLITEAGIEAFLYGSTHLQKNCTNGIYRVCFAEENEALNSCNNIPILKNHDKTNWRVVVAAENKQTLIASNIVTSLTPSYLGDTGWIQPCVSAWSWWSDPQSPKDYSKLKSFIDFSSQMKWPYFLVDANWNLMPKGSIEKIAKYAKDRNVGIFLWYNSGGKNNVVTEQPRDKMDNRDKRRSEMEWMEKIGIKGIKVDFFQSDKPQITNLYKEILADAMDYHLLVNFHGCTLPKGWERTYPNLMSHEAVQGAECYGFSNDYAINAPSQNTIHCFSRNVVGPMDYTPTTFSNIKYPHLTTNGHELALSILYQSGIVHIADAANSIQSTPSYIISFLQNLPTTWDEIKYLYGEPGKDAVLARKHNGKWYIAGINGENIEKEILLDLSFIDNDILILINDDENNGFAKSSIKVSKEFTIKLRPYGGFILIDE